jgi:hypothetical protein
VGVDPDPSVCFDIGCTAPGIVVEMLRGSNAKQFESGMSSPTEHISRTLKIDLPGKDITGFLLQITSGGALTWREIFLIPKGSDLLEIYARDTSPYDEVVGEILSTMSVKQ